MNTITSSSASAHGLHAFWELEWNIQYYYPTSVSYQDDDDNWNTISSSTSGRCDSGSTEWYKVRFTYQNGLHGDVYADSQGTSGTGTKHYWGAYPAPLPVTYFSTSMNDGYNLGNYPMGTDEIYINFPAADTSYMTYSMWYTNLHA